MSFVGPRPLLVEYLPLYSEEQRIRHKIRPGITGLAQICGRNQLSWDHKFKLDIFYVENYSFLMDLRILFITLFKVLIRHGVNAEGEATVKKFEGRAK
jgi:undecaprenyl phosphate N,N'-diacetylbacillosamine 1-phosphate transferase